MRIALTGHRPQRLGFSENELDEKWNKIDKWLTEEILLFLEECEPKHKTLDLYCGMASGSDILFGLCARDIKPSTDYLKLHCILPCKNYNSSHQFYNNIKNASDEWVELSDEFYKGCDSVRDQYMVDHCDVLLAVWDGIKSGGVWSTIRKAQKAGKQIIYYPKEILENKYE